MTDTQNDTNLDAQLDAAIEWSIAVDFREAVPDESTFYISVLKQALTKLVEDEKREIEKKLWIARSDVAYLLGMVRELGYPHEGLEKTYGHGQATKPEKGTS